jgi:predicted metal-dependent HD superfamily phosphohydrolase
MRNDLTDKFLSKWRALAADLGLDDAKSREVGDYLLAQYAADDRHYHDVRHIVSMLDGFDALKTRFAQPLASELAIFFHDVIYDASRQDNEEQSARKLRELLGDFVAGELVDIATSTIEATKKHAATSNTDTNLVLDLEMAILGQPWAVYERYAKGVMQEYLPVYGEATYREGRLRLFLEPTIAHGNIFLTEEFEHLTEPTVRNLQREAVILKSGNFTAGEGNP